LIAETLEPVTIFRRDLRTSCLPCSTKLQPLRAISSVEDAVIVDPLPVVLNVSDDCLAALVHVHVLNGDLLLPFAHRRCDYVARLLHLPDL
jgi:hypothetical protein